ncbi:arsenate reductase family protein [Amycolatopsis sp. 195334CR]|uniref:arsenate reductase family protein n=1 Tax=Amycolatopsis sp. 195334CR TaxID=2814588 RepID=UPI001A8E808A|nr:arsenate reductase family protein [Amycolatopsis sp. 195334CR]MBN6042191.1 arsenate reductase family protein [Amycolatopsis sp. 195334CR]
MEIWHNPRCTKSRAAKKALDEAGTGYTERRYLDSPPTAAELTEVLTKLGQEPWEITRTKEPVAKDLGLGDLPRDAANRGRWIELLAEHPVLIQRPILIDGDTAVVGRDEDSLREIL